MWHQVTIRSIIQVHHSSRNHLVAEGRRATRALLIFRALRMTRTDSHSVTLAALGPGGAACAAPAQANACLLDNVLASAITAGTAKSGYYYGVGGVVAGALVLTYTVGSSAVVFNQTGVRNFCSSDDGVIHFESPAGQSAPVTTTAACQAFTVLQ